MSWGQYPQKTGLQCSQRMALVVATYEKGSGNDISYNIQGLHAI